MLKRKSAIVMVLKALTVLMISLGLTACLGTVVGTAVDVTLEVAKVPFKVVGAVVDVATPEEDDDDED
jgi:hypothetical protein